MARHLDALFSEAFDGALDDDARVRFDDHLAGCPRCRAAFAEYAGAIQAVRELPPARMPVAVVIPATAPELAAEPRRRPWEGLAERLRSPGPVLGGLGLAAAGIAAVVIAVHVGHGGTGSTQTPTALGESRGAGGASAVLGPAVAAADCAAGHGIFAVTGTTAAAGAAAAPQGFDNAVRQSNPSRPGQQLILATTGSSFHAGDQVTVYARLTSAGSATAIVPCVSLAGVTAPAAAGAGVPAAPPAAPAPGVTSAGAASAPDLAAPTAEPTTAGPAGSAPLLSVTIPAGVAPGTVLRLVAQVPAGIPDQPNATVEAVLTITVS